MASLGVVADAGRRCLRWPLGTSPVGRRHVRPTEFLAPHGDGVGHKAVRPNASQRQSEGPEHSSQPRNQTPLYQGLIQRAEVHSVRKAEIVRGPSEIRVTCASEALCIRMSNQPNTEAECQSRSIRRSGSNSRVPRHAGHLLGLVSLFSSNIKPQALQRAGSTSTACPAAWAERRMCRRSSSMSLRRRPSSRARLDGVRGPAMSRATRSRRKAIVLAQCVIA